MTSQISVAKTRQRRNWHPTCFSFEEMVKDATVSFFLFNQLDPTYNWELMGKERFLELPLMFFYVYVRKQNIELNNYLLRFFGFPTCFMFPPVLGISKVCRGSSCSGAIYCLFCI